MCVCVCVCVRARRVIILLSSQTVQTFVSTKFNPLALDYHILSLQQLTSLCMAHPLLQDELYCQVIRQISTTTDPLCLSSQQVCMFVLYSAIIIMITSSTQAWFLLYLLLPLFLPKRQLFVWYLKAFLSRKSSCESNVVSDLAQHCEHRLVRTQRNGVREKKPSWFEVSLCTLLHQSLYYNLHIVTLAAVSFSSSSSYSQYKAQTTSASTQRY